ncbi:uncharacterized protein LOC133852602 [Alnus glutinosa]|uniref:uncharacterized protein LOC133852602 n=1 Tax=Alnus glutinosa TaxID=3517 RepID=UPI002D78AF39|nr:uncharacterized protein LOC133852602 [Alnus glutinosa]
MAANVTPVDIKKVIFAMNKHKAPGLDGFSAGFYQRAWAIVRQDVLDAVLEFFQTCSLLKRVNTTIITLVPKKKNSATMGDYRPISCCNIIYKCITKILANRLLSGLDDIISSNQGAFIPKMSISKNILLAQEMMNEGVFLVKCLGVPLITKRLMAADCESLVLKFTTRIDSWLVKHLSFAGRLQLIKSFLCSLQVYWCRILILLKKVISLLEQKLNRFLWCGQDVKAKAKVVWDKVRSPKKEWGLGIKRLEVWNQASMLIRIWNLFAKAECLWVAWVDEVWLKGKSLWQIPIPQTCSWSWRKILKLRPIARSLLSFKVGDGSKIFLWYDTWHLAGCLIDRYGYRVVYDAGFSIGPKLSSIIRNGEWYWKSVRSNSLAEIQSRLPKILIGSEDIPV